MPQHNFQNDVTCQSLIDFNNCGMGIYFFVLIVLAVFKNKKKSKKICHMPELNLTMDVTCQSLIDFNNCGRGMGMGIGMGIGIGMDIGQQTDVTCQSLI